MVASLRLGRGPWIRILGLLVASLILIPCAALGEKVSVTSSNQQFFRKLALRLVCYYDSDSGRSALGRIVAGNDEQFWIKEKARALKALKKGLVARVKAAGGSLKRLESRKLSAPERKYYAFVRAVKACRSFLGPVPDDGNSTPPPKGDTPPTDSENPELPLAVLETESFAKEGSEIWLDGSKSHNPSGGALSYDFSQVGGPPVQLRSPQKDNDNGMRFFVASFAAPLTEQAELAFELRVKDGLRESLPVRALVTINEGAGVCGDGVCGLSQTAENCPFDCKVATQEKDVKIQYPTYSTRSVIHYALDGTKTVLTDKVQVQDFLLNTLDLTINGNIPGISGNLAERRPDLPALTYLQMNSIWSTSQRELWDLVKNDEAAFVHAKDEPLTADSRLRIRCCEQQYLMYPGAPWRQYYANYALTMLQRNTSYDGIFMDNGLGRLITTNRFWRPIVNYEATVGSDGRTISLPGFKLHVWEKYYECANPIGAFDNPELIGTNYFTGGSNTQTTVILGTSRPAGSKVYLNFWAIDVPAPEVVNSWPQDMAESFRYIKERLGNYLFVFNGIVWSWTEDNILPSLSDGGMDEQFIFPPWAELPSGVAGISETGWLTQVTELSQISRDRIFLAQAGAVLTGALPDEEIRMQRVAMFAFTSFLLGKERYAYFHFALAPGSYQNYAYFDYWQVKLGDPMPGPAGEFHIREQIAGSNIYEREFEDALVLVNPSDVVGERLVNLGSIAFYTLDGSPVKEVILPEKSGIILHKDAPG